MGNAIKHKFHSQKFNSEFYTQQAILMTPNYKPEVMVLGTFNPQTPHANYADFFYGRNYFWPALYNLFIDNRIALKATRMPRRGKPKSMLKPSIEEIFILCNKLRLTFSDLVLAVLHKKPNDYTLLKNDNVLYKGCEYNLIQDGKKRQIGGLEQLNNINQVQWNTDNIIEYLRTNKQIKSIYLTRQPTGIWKTQFNRIRYDKPLKNRMFTNIFTPSGQGQPVWNSMEKLLNHWINNQNNNFGKLNNDWLQNNMQNLKKFQENLYNNNKL